MAQDPVYSGPLAGRFYRLGEKLKPGTSLVNSALEHAWSPSSAPTVSSRTFCQGELPHEGDLGEDTVELAYQDGGSGVWRLWLREETRKAGKMAVQQRAAQLALERDPDTPLTKMLRSSKAEVLMEAKGQLIGEAVPHIRVVPVVVVDDWLWIGRRSAVTDRTYIHLLRQVVGDLQEDPLLWDEGGWSSCSFATLMEFTRVKAGELAPDVHLLDLQVQGQNIQLKATDSAEAVRKVLAEMTASVAETGVKRLSFEVVKDGVRIVVDVDHHGVYRAVPMRSVGGLPHERIRRRFGDVRYAASRIRDVMGELVTRFEEAS